MIVQGLTEKDSVSKHDLNFPIWTSGNWDRTETHHLLLAKVIGLMD